MGLTREWIKFEGQRPSPSMGEGSFSTSRCLPNVGYGLPMPRALNPQITRFILANVGARPDDIGPLTAKRFGVTRATASNYLRRLTEQGLLSPRGATRARSYSLKHVVHLRGIGNP